MQDYEAALIILIVLFFSEKKKIFLIGHHRNSDMWQNDRLTDKSSIFLCMHMFHRYNKIKQNEI